jgi:hypothetical protein
MCLATLYAVGFIPVNVIYIASLPPLPSSLVFSSIRIVSPSRFEPENGDR